MSNPSFFKRCAGLMIGLCALTFVAGCGSGFKLTGVTVSLVDIKPAEATVLESSAVLTLRYSNENVIPIGLSGSSHKVYLNGSYVGKALSKEPVGLAALTTTTQDVTVRFENLALMRQFVAMRERQTAAYKIESVLYVTSGEEELNIKTSNSGSVDLRALTSGAK
jgi:LEA14-like dessication related protein